LSFFITTNQYIHYYALNTLHIFTMYKIKITIPSTAETRQSRGRATEAVARVSRLIYTKTK